MKTRNYGIDFLRMISMIMIVMLHTLGHGGILRSVSFLSVHYQIAWLLEVIAFGAVNTYAMISGFVSVDSLNITVRQSRQSGVARATCPD